MKPVRSVEGRAIPFGAANVDTDIIIPAHWLKTITREGLGAARSKPCVKIRTIFSTAKNSAARPS